MTSRHAVRRALALLSLALVLAMAATTVAVADDPGPTASAARAGVTLRKGDRGPAVSAVQRRLRLNADGVFGPLTHRAVRRFQRRRGLAVDGIVGPVTRRALRLRPFRASSVTHPRKRARTTPPARSGGIEDLPRVLKRIAQCESGGNPRAVSPDLFHVQHELVKAVSASHGDQRAGRPQGGHRSQRAARTAAKRPAKRG